MACGCMTAPVLTFPSTVDGCHPSQFPVLCAARESGTACGGMTAAAAGSRYPGAADSCSAACGLIYEPFWDECGRMLHAMNMGGPAAGRASVLCGPGWHTLPENDGKDGKTTVEISRQGVAASGSRQWQRGLIRLPCPSVAS